MDLDNYNCIYTSGKVQVGISISALIKLITELPERPKIFTMPIEIIKSDIMPKNYILLSKNVAEALEQAIEENRHLTVKGAS